MMLLLALELLAIALCSGSARSEPGPNDTTTGAIADELRGAGREWRERSGVSDLPLLCLYGVGTRMRRSAFAFAQGLTEGRREPLLARKMCRADSTDGIRAGFGQLLH